MVSGGKREVVCEGGESVSGGGYGSVRVGV